MNHPLGIRIGHGYDAHRFAPGRPLVLGGVRIVHPQGLEGHSDADVLTHAVTDALLGAAALGDMGLHFPSRDERWKNADSMKMLKLARHKAEEIRAHPIQLDCTLYLEEPNVAMYVDRMRERLAEALQLIPAQVSVKATTNDGMGFVGRKEGAAASAVILMGID